MLELGLMRSGLQKKAQYRMAFISIMRKCKRFKVFILMLLIILEIVSKQICKH